MKDLIAVGTKVVAPVSDDNGEISFVIGTLIKINSRMATVDCGDGKIIKCGKTKIEVVEVEEVIEKPTKLIDTECPKCGIKTSDEDAWSIEEAKESSIAVVDYREMKRTHWCSKCDVVFGPRVSLSSNNLTKGYKYLACIAASGRMSVDNGDEVAAELRGAPLEEVYEKVSEYIGETIDALKVKYGHLNPGHQRMCLGNRLRSFIKKNKTQ